MNTGLGRRGAFEEVALYIRRMIFDGELRRGDRVPQDEIAATLQVSRIPVREALIALERESWVSIQPHRGAFVVGYDESSVTDHYEVLGLIYGLVARRAAAEATDEQIATLIGLQKAVASAADADTDEFLAANDQLLAALRRVGGSPRISSILRSMSALIPGNFFAEVEGAIATQVKGTKATVRAIKAHDGDAAADAVTTMLRDLAKHALDVLNTRGIIA